MKELPVKKVNPLTDSRSITFKLVGLNLFITKLVENLMKPNSINFEFKVLHKFRSKILGMTAYKKGLIVTTERGTYWFPTPKSKPRKIRTDEPDMKRKAD